MREFSQTNGCIQPPAKRKPLLPLGGGFRLAWIWMAAWLGLAHSGVGQTMKLGPFALTITGRGEVGYDSNVDEVYPEEEEDGLKKGDFYWMPGLSIQSESIPMYPRVMLNLSAALDYQDYFYRNDLDEEIYQITLDFQTTHPRLTLGGMGSVKNEVEGVEDQYVPGSVSRDPVLTTEGNVFANWNYRKVRLETMAEYSKELHEEEEYQAGDEEETTLEAAAYWDLFTWGSLFYSWEHTETTLLQSEDVTDETIHTFGIDGAVPVDLLRRPRITYSFGVSYEDEQTDATDDDDEPTWEPTHTIGVSDEYDLSRSLRLTYSALWEDSWESDSPSFYLPGEKRDDDEDEVTFEYNVKLTQKLGTRAEHSLTFSQEPESTFGSTADTKSTEFAYDFQLRDLLVYGLDFHASALYELETPLGTEDAVTEKTTTLATGLTHTRQLSRQLSRVLAYEYSWENSNFHDEGAMQQHLVTYGLTYLF